ncbi:MAG: Rossmann-like domain-containing protein [Dissulfuribacterales bacterium]
MDIRKKIRTHVSKPAKQHRIKAIRIGLGYTAVMLDNGQVGLAYTPHRDMPAGCTLFPNFLPNKNISATELLELITSDNNIETAVGLATANAMTNSNPENFLSGDVLDLNLLHKDDCVGMVGNFAPLIASIRKKTKSLIIFEQIDQPKGDLIPSAEIKKRLPDCTVALITATSIINHTFDAIMEAAVNCRQIIIIGASTPLVSEVFSNTPVTSLSGVIVTDADEILRIVSFGGGMRMFKNCIQKVNLKV